MVALERGDLPGPVIGTGAETVQEDDGRGVGHAPAAALVVNVRLLRRRWRPSPCTSSAAPWARGSPRSRTTGAPGPSTGTRARPAAWGATSPRAARRGRRVRGNGPRAWRSSPAP